MIDLKDIKFLSFLLTLLPIVAAAQQENTDTIAHEQTLQEVTVEATSQRTSTNVTTYLPDRNVKRTAQNAVDLLGKMAIPQINVNPIAGSVQTNSGNDVAIFIDYEKASQAEKDAINPQDVRKVEYLVYPTDPRFGNEKYVINIVLFHYDYGGYVKLTGTDNLIVGSGNGQAYLKMSYKKMTYDLSIYNKYTDRGHTGTEQTQVFRLPQADGTIAEVTRSTTLDDSRYQQNYFWASLRAKYAAEKTTISNTLNIISTNAPHNDYSGRVVFSSPLFQTAESAYANLADEKVVNPYWSGNYYFDFGKQWNLSISPWVDYTHTVSNRHYISDGTDIVTDASENYFNAKISTTLSKTFKKYHTLRFFLFGAYVHDKVKYTGSTVASPTFRQYGWTAFPYYNFAKEKFNLQIGGGVVSESNTISGVTNNSLLPVIQFESSYSPSDKHQFELSVNYNFGAVEMSDKTPDVIQSNELLYQTGNPLLKNLSFVKSDFTYTWLPSNKFSMTGFGGWIRRFDYITPVFTPDGPDGLMLRSLENGGDYQELYVGSSVSLKLFDRSLILNVNPEVVFQKQTGRYADTNTFPMVNVSATYYLKNFYFSAYYLWYSKTMLRRGLDMTHAQGKDYYSMQAGWSNGKWNISASAINIFRKNWLADTSWLNSQWFDQTTQTYSANSHQFVSLSASYIFSFGKKIRQGDELQNSSSSSSAIMK
ncbi:MAG: hypothetical protein J1E57_08605 [Prevotella sp.]|nr:hypothetical protein [Prevotella sp.]